MEILPILEGCRVTMTLALHVNIYRLGVIDLIVASESRTFHACFVFERHLSRTSPSSVVEILSTVSS